MKTPLRIGAAICAALSPVAAGAAEPAALRELVRSVDYEPGWSPDGESLVVSNRNGAMNLYRLAANGGAPRRLTDHAGPDDTPAWSPDGRTIAFVSEVDGNPEICLVDADGGEPSRLFERPGRYTNPRWSPRGDEIVFTGRAPGDGDLELYAVAAPPP